jgi:hypothetical protein
MCINGEEIRVGKTGFYGLKNGVITVNFFSVCQALEEANSQNLSNWIHNRANDGSLVKDYIGSVCLFNDDKKPRVINNFILDYMYQTN